MNMKELPLTLAQGQAAVHRVLAELLLRRIPCYIPAVDVGVDIALDDGTRLQVKSSKLRSVRSGGRNPNSPSLGPAYRFSLSMKLHGNFDQGSWRRHASSRPYTLRKYSEEVNFLVLWGIDEDRFWIVPADVCNERQGLVLYPGKRVPQVCPTQQPFARVVHSYEGRWDQLMPTPEAAPLRAVEEAS